MEADSSAAGDQDAEAQREQGSPRHVLPEAPGELDRRHTDPSGRSTHSDRMPWTPALGLPIQDPHQMADSTAESHFAKSGTGTKDARGAACIPKLPEKAREDGRLTYELLRQ